MFTNILGWLVAKFKRIRIRGTIPKETTAEGKHCSVPFVLTRNLKEAIDHCRPGLTRLFATRANTLPSIIAISRRYGTPKNKQTPFYSQKLKANGALLVSTLLRTLILRLMFVRILDNGTLGNHTVKQNICLSGWWSKLIYIRSPLALNLKKSLLTRRC